jgi:hypothetical protein
MSEQLIKPETSNLMKFDELKSLPDILTANETSLMKAKAAIQPLIDTWAGIDLASADAEETEELDKQLADAQYKISQTIPMLENRRKPGTRILNEIVKKFTGVENDAKLLADAIGDARNAWQAEKARRHAAEESAREAELKAKQDEIEKTAAQQELLHKGQTQLINSTVERMITKYNSLPADGLDAYCDAIGKLNLETYSIQIGIDEKYLTLFMAAMKDNITALVEQKESRKAELWSNALGAAARVAREAAERKEAQELAEREAAFMAKQQAEALKLEASFTTMAQPIETPELSKGTVVKRKYVVKTHGGHIAIIRWWTQNIMPSMSVEDLNKKLSFMRTAADKALAQGDTLEAPGLEVVQDYSTRSTKQE